MKNRTACIAGLLAVALALAPMTSVAGGFHGGRGF